MVAVTMSLKMMNDRVLYELLYEFIHECIIDGETTDEIMRIPKDVWENFWVDSSQLTGRYEEIEHLIRSIAKEIDRKDKLKCQYCRVDAGFFVKPPVEPHNLCKTHLQEYEIQYIDRTLTQVHPALGNLVNHIGKKINDA